MIIQLLEFTAGQVTCARFKRRGRQLLPLLGLRLDCPDHATAGRLLQQQLPPLADEHRTILSLSPDLLTLRDLQLPMDDRKKLRAVLPLELASESPDDAGMLLADALTIAPGSQLAGWVQQQTVADLLDQLHPFGFDPEIVTCAPLCWHHLVSPGAETVLLLRNDALTVASEGRLLFCRFMDTTDRTALERTLTALALSRGITPTQTYTLESPPQEGQHPLPIPPELAEATATGDLPAPALLSCLAMARAYLQGEIFNLRTGALAWRGARSQLLRRFRLPIVLGAVALLMLFGEAGLRWYLLKRDLNSLNSAVQTIYKGVFPNRARAVDEAGEIRSEIKRLQGGGNGADLLRFLHLLAQSKDEQLIGLSELEYDGERFRLKGDARTQQAVNSLVQKLAAAGISAEPPELTGRADGSILFTLKGRSKGGTP